MFCCIYLKNFKNIVLSALLILGFCMQTIYFKFLVFLSGLTLYLWYFYQFPFLFVYGTVSFTLIFSVQLFITLPIYGVLSFLGPLTLLLGLCESVTFVRAVFSCQPNNRLHRSVTSMKAIGLFKPCIRQRLLVILSLL